MLCHHHLQCCSQNIGPGQDGGVRRSKQPKYWMMEWFGPSRDSNLKKKHSKTITELVFIFISGPFFGACTNSLDFVPKLDTQKENRCQIGVIEIVLISNPSTNVRYDMVGPLCSEYLLVNIFSCPKDPISSSKSSKLASFWGPTHPCYTTGSGPLPLQGPIILRVAKMSKHKHHPWALGGGTKHQNPTDVNQCVVKRDIFP